HNMIFIILVLSCLIPFTTAAFGATTSLAKIPLVDFCLADANRSDITYYLFKSASQTTAITLTEEDYTLPRNDTNLPTKVLIHGYTTNVSAPWFKQLKREYFRKKPHNIIYVDWSLAARVKNYYVSSANINPVGEYIANFIINLRIPFKNVHVIGNSLGGHLAGFVGKHLYLKTGKKLGRITATDPTGPSFERAVAESRLSKQDAEFVDVVHTDMGYYGATRPLGHVDFYVNGGRNQPGCRTGHETDENCHHVRSNYYFIESINKRNVMAKAANLNEKEEIIVTDHREEIEFGDPVDTKARGIYYLKTNSVPPYLNSKIK
ncbi:Lipase domain containing protein, partial [Asbolus verrucosus]